MLSLYELKNEYKKLADEIIESADDETGEVDMAIAERFADVSEAFEVKAQNVAVVIRNFTATEKAIDDEIARLTALKKKYHNGSEKLKENLKDACLLLGYEKIESVSANISFRKSEEVVIDNLDLIPEEFVKEKITYTADKMAIKKAIKDGQVVDGAHIEKNKNIQIK